MKIGNNPTEQRGNSSTDRFATLARAQQEKTRLTERVYHPDPCPAGYQRRRGAVMLSEICHYQWSYKFLVSMLPFMRLVREILSDDEQICRNDWCIQSSALMVLQTAAKAFLVSHFEDVSLNQKG